MEEDDMILPDDFEETPSDEIEVDPSDFEELIEPEAEDTTPADGLTVPTEPLTPTQKLKLTYNGQELEVEAEEAAILAQKGMNYEKAVERARQESAQQAKDEVIASFGYEWQGKKITTEAEYKRAVEEKQLLDKYSQLDPELAQELIDSRRDREERNREKEAKAVEDKQRAEFDDFLGYFQAVNERGFDAQKDKFPQEVLAAVNSGQSLKVAYMEYHNKELRNQLKIAKQNEMNKSKAPVSGVTAGGGTKTESEDDFLAGFNSI